MASLNLADVSEKSLDIPKRGNEMEKEALKWKRKVRA
jgi:hypothetical protein